VERMLQLASIGGCVRQPPDTRKQSNAHRGIEQEICWHWHFVGCSRAPNRCTLQPVGIYPLFRISTLGETTVLDPG
jgi:hypothetical protein